ncbi:MAG: TonB family protein [Steroidobacteraceae bacterium]
MAHPAASESRDSAGETVSAGMSAARPAVELTALTAHDDFLLELGELLGGRASVHPADSIDAAVQQLGAGRGGQILAIDARGSGEIRADVQRASEQAPDAVILLFTEAGAEKSLSAAVKGTPVFAVLSLPMEPAKASAVLDAALSDALTRSAPPQPATRPQRHIAPPAHAEPAAEATSSREAPASGRRKLLLPAIGVGALVVLAGAAMLLMRREPANAPLAAARRPATPAPGAAQPRFVPLPTPQLDTSIVQGRLDELLEKASRAMFARHFTAPRGDNALVYYRSALAVDPTNGEARDGLRRVGNVLVSRFQDDIGQGHLNRAALALATLALAEPADEHLRPFGIALSSAQVNQALGSAQLSALPALIAQAAARGVPAAQIAVWQGQLASLQNQQQLQKIAQQIAHRIATNRLTGPSSAASALERLRALAPNAAATQSAEQALSGVLLREARRAGLAGQSAAEDQWLSAAGTAGASAQAVAEVRQQVTVDLANAAHRRLEQLLATAAARLQSGALLRPSGDSAAHYLTAIAADHPGPDIAQAAERLRSQLASALVARAEAAAQAGQHATAVEDLAAARHWGASEPTLQSAVTLAATPSPPTAAQLAQVADQLRRTHYVPPVYPQRALTDRIAGEVTVQYVVDRSGRTRDLQVVNANPALVFNRAALDAIRQWRYSPPKFHGQPLDVPVRTMIRFELPN